MARDAGGLCFYASKAVQGLDTSGVDGHCSERIYHNTNLCLKDHLMSVWLAAEKARLSCSPIKKQFILTAPVVLSRRRCFPIPRSRWKKRRTGLTRLPATALMTR